MSSPLSNATLEDWRSEIYITGNNLPAANQSTSVGTLNWGFDATISNNPSVFWYDESVAGTSNQGWVAITNNTSSLSDVSLTVGKGYRVFVRGDRSTGRLDGTDNSQNIVTMDLNGLVNKGNIKMPVSFTSSGTLVNDGWCLLGNPYPSAFDWNAFYDNGVNISHVNPTAYVFDAETNAYVSYNANSNSGSLTNGIIPQGAGFFIQTNAASPSMTFTETFKTTATHYNTFKTSTDDMMIKCIADSINIDKFTLKYMSEATDNFDSYDISKLSNPTVNLYSLGTDSIHLATSVRNQQVRMFDTILLGISSAFKGIHKFEFTNVQNFANNKKVSLIDNYTSTRTDILKQAVYSFDIDSNPDSYGNKRFKLVIFDSLMINTGIDQMKVNSNIQFTLFPNPATDKIYIHSGNSHINQVELKIIDVSGRNILRKSTISFDKDMKIELNTSELREGVYFIQILTPDYRTSVMKFVKII